MDGSQSVRAGRRHHRSSPKIFAAWRHDDDHGLILDLYHVHDLRHAHRDPNCTTPLIAKHIVSARSNLNGAAVQEPLLPGLWTLSRSPTSARHLQGRRSVGRGGGGGSGLLPRERPTPTPTVRPAETQKLKGHASVFGDPPKAPVSRATIFRPILKQFGSSLKRPRNSPSVEKPFFDQF